MWSFPTKGSKNGETYPYVNVLSTWDTLMYRLSRKAACPSILKQDELSLSFTS